MPCNCDHLEPNKREEESKHVAWLIVEFHEAWGNQPAPKWVRDAAENVYGNVARVNELTAMLCEMCRDLPDGVIYNGRNKTARKLADWWDDHKVVDEKRVRKELEELESELEIQQDRLDDATTKLNQLEDEADALREVLRNTYGDCSQ